MNYIWRVVVKASVGCGWWILYEGDDRETADATYKAHRETKRTVMEKI